MHKQSQSEHKEDNSQERMNTTQYSITSAAVENTAQSYKLKAHSQSLIGINCVRQLVGAGALIVSPGREIRQLVGGERRGGAHNLHSTRSRVGGHGT